MTVDMVHETNLEHPPELVWRVLASPDGLNTWLMETDFSEPRVGHRFCFRDRPRPFWDGVCPCEVAEADPPRRFALRWNTRGGEPSVVSWTLSPAPGGGTRVEFRHGNLAGVMGFMMRQGMNKGWQRMLTRSLPFVLARLSATGAMPSRGEVREVFRGKRHG